MRSLCPSLLNNDHETLSKAPDKKKRSIERFQSRLHSRPAARRLAGISMAALRYAAWATTARPHVIPVEKM